MADIDANLADLLSRAKTNLGADASDAAKTRIEARLEAVATSLALEWITGEQRFESQGQQMEYWLARIYEALYPDEQPNASRLYLRFGLPLPRAQYLTRLLLARRSAHWRDTAHAEVVAVLEPWEKDAAEAKKKGVGSSTPYKLSLSRGAYDELIVIYDRMAAPVAAKDRPSPPKREPSSPTMVWFQISALGVLALLEQIRKDL